MFIEPKAEGLSFADLLDAAYRHQSRSSYFPYTNEVCRCRYCSYCKAGKCSLEECCCMEERVKAHSCTFTEILNHSYSNIKDSVFKYRLRIAAERATIEKSCFLDKEHRCRFTRAIAMSRRDDFAFIAQLYILTATEELWESANSCMTANGITYFSIPFHDLGENGYTFFSAAFDLENGTSHTDIDDLSNDEVVDFDVFRVITNAIVIAIYGMDAVKVAEKNRKRKRKNRKEINDAGRET